MWWSALGRLTRRAAAHVRSSEQGGTPSPLPEPPSCRGRWERLRRLASRPEPTSGVATKIGLNGASKGAVQGEPFNRALTRIWVGDTPVQLDLKKAMLGG